MKPSSARLRDLEAKTAQPDAVPAEQRHSVFTTVPLVTGGASDNYRSDVQGWLIPVDLDGKRMFFHSFRVWVQAQQAQTDFMVVALYEALPARLGINDSPTGPGNIQVRRLGFSFAQSLTGDVDGDAESVVVKTTPVDILLEPDKQYYVYLYANSSRVRFLCPSTAFTAVLAKGDTPSASRLGPDMLELARVNDGTQRPAPLVELRSRYRGAIFGDTSLE